MHERSLVRALMRQVEALAVEHSAGRIVGIRVQIGEFSGIEPDLFRSAYRDMAELTDLQGADLAIERVPLEAVCQECWARFAIEGFCFQCANCSSAKLSIVGGEELILESVTMEEWCDE